VLAVRYRTRAIFGLTLMASQAFFYNAIFFTYALVLARFYGVPDDRVGYYIFPFAIGNFLGPLVLGHLFDTVGRRFMIALTYSVSGLGLLATGYAFQQEMLTATTQALCWSAIFFVASAARARPTSP
jgi:MFS family permease